MYEAPANNETASVPVETGSKPEERKANPPRGPVKGKTGAGGMGGVWTIFKPDRKQRGLWEMDTQQEPCSERERGRESERERARESERDRARERR